MRALTQGCEDGGDIWLSHIGANEIVAGRMWLMKALVVVANAKGSCCCGSGCVCVQDRERETKRRRLIAVANGKRELALLCSAFSFCHTKVRALH
jgi:hypothetical protein